MPIFQMKCNHCGHRESKLTFKSGVPGTVNCPQCRGEMMLVLSPPALQFNGPGFYSTDYKETAEPYGGVEITDA